MKTAQAGVSTLLGIVGLLVHASMAGAAPQLYETGPAQDLALLRFVNATEGTVQVKPEARAASGLSLTRLAPVSDLQPARADRPVAGFWTAGKQDLRIDERLAPGASATLVLWSAAGTLHYKAFVEPAARFDGVRASLAFFNADVRCAKASLTATPQNRAIFQDLPFPGMARRALNPVMVNVKAACNGQDVDAVLDLGQLDAGQRYSVFLLPAGTGHRLVGGQDRLAP